MNSTLFDLQIRMERIVRDTEILEARARRECEYAIAAAMVVDARHSIEDIRLEALARQQADDEPPPALDWSGQHIEPPLRRAQGREAG